MASFGQLLLPWLLGAVVTLGQACTEPDLLSYHVVAEYPHDQDAFTQGLEFGRDCNDFTMQCTDVLWESTGLYGRSSIRLVDLNTGVVRKQTNLNARLFGEGLARQGDKLYQLTWQTPTVLVYSADTLKQVAVLRTPLRDGWGLTPDKSHLVISNGTAALSWFNPATQEVDKSLKVTDHGRPVSWLNELELIDGDIWANIWQTECIARINTTSGHVTQWLLLSGLLKSLSQRPQHKSHKLDVLNGIAWDSLGQRLFVTGKLWPRIFEVVPQPLTDPAMTLAKVRSMCIQ